LDREYTQLHFLGLKCFVGWKKMSERIFLRLICLLCVFKLCMGFIGGKMSQKNVLSSSTSILRKNRVFVDMTVTDNPPTSSSGKKVTNAFNSPSIVKFTKDASELIDAFDSPSCQMNGGTDQDTAINPRKSPSVIMMVPEGQDAVDALASPGVKYLGVDKEAAKNAMTSPSLLTTSESKTKLDMPLSLIVGQETIKTALILLAVNPNIGGLAIAGGKGTGKSAMARALHRIMPPIERIKGSPYNIDPEARVDQVDDFFKAELEETGKKLEDYDTEVITCPFVQVPVNVMEDRLFGSVDVKKTLETGETVFTPGLMADAHRGILYVDDVNLLDTDLVTMMLAAVTDGFVIVEREGISVKYPCKPLMIATLNPEDSELKDVFLDRIGVALNADTNPLTMDERITAVDKVIKFQKGEFSDLELQELYNDEEKLRNSIIFAREYLKDTKISTEQLTYLCEEAYRGGCQGHRAEISAARVAIASAALDSAEVRADDLRLAVKLAIFPRSIFADQIPPDDMMIEPPPPPPPPPSSSNEPENNLDNDDSNEEDNDNEDNEENEEDDEEEMGEPSIPEEFMFDAEAVGMEDDMMKFGGRQKQGKGGKSGLIMSRDRGRYLRPVPPKDGEPLRVAIDATLREAAKNQVWRRKEAAAQGKDPNRIYLEPSDVRGKLMARKAGSLLIFAVDASGSMALNRMNAAKGACVGLLQEAYQSRDKIALIPFQGSKAEVLLPPTRSISLAKNRLDVMPCGGGSPLAHALTQAVRTGVNAMAAGDTGRCVIILISDGRANVKLDISLGIEEEQELSEMDTDGKKKKLTDAEKKEQRTFLKEEVLGIARQIGAMPAFKLLVIDTENKFVSTGVAKEIAQAAGGKYHYIPKASGDAIATVASQAVQSLKASTK
jgi:magnesium chelatase subunit D